MTLKEAGTVLARAVDRREELLFAATSLRRETPRYPAKSAPWEPERWQVNDFGDLITVNGDRDPIYAEAWEGGGPRDRAVADFMAANDPAHTMRMVSALRKVLDAHASAVHAAERVNRPIGDLYGHRARITGRRQAFEEVVTILAEALTEE